MNDKVYNILFIEAGFGCGGSSIFLYYLLKNLDKERFKPSVVFYHRVLGPDAQKIEGLGIDVYQLDKKEVRPAIEKPKPLRTPALLIRYVIRDLVIALRIKKIVRSNRIDLLVFNNDIHYHVPGIIASMITGRPCVCRKAGIGGGRAVKKVLGRFVKRYYVISLATLEDFLAEKLPARKMETVIYEGIDLNGFKPVPGGKGIRKELNIPENASVIGSISRLSRTKGQLELIDVASRVVESEPNVFFLIVGSDFDPNERLLKELRAETVARGIERNIHFLGWRNEIREILVDIDIFIQNSLYPEGLGISCLEAMAMGKPTIATRMGGLSETTIDGLTGFTFPPDQPDRMTEAILKLIRDQNLREEMGKNARKFAEARFDISKSGDRIGQIYLHAIEKN